MMLLGIMKDTCRNAGNIGRLPGDIDGVLEDISRDTGVYKFR
jgi:hypothetical protein